VPNIAIGGSGFGPGGQKETAAILAAAHDLGMNLVDTSDNYGESEAIIGNALAGRRSDYLIATKCGHHPNAPGASRRSIKMAIDESLRRLQTDYIDLFQIHAPDPITPLEETIATLQNLVQQGKILYYGLSNFSAWQLVDAYHLAKAMNGPLPISMQAQVSLVNLKNHRNLSLALQRTRVGLLAASPLARGLLGRSYSTSNPPPNGHVLGGSKGTLTMTPANLQVVERLDAASHARGCKPVTLALAAVLSLPNVVSAVVRPRQPDDLADYIEAQTLEVSHSELSQIAFGDANLPFSRTQLGVVG